MSKNYKGGYKLIDLEKVDFLELEVGAVIKGIHAKIESSYAKALMLTGIVIDGVEKNDVMISELKVVDGSFVFKAYGYEITVTDEDEVEAVEIHVPVVKSVTSSAEEKEIDIKDGDEYLLSSTNEDGTTFKFPNDCHLIITSSAYKTFENKIYGYILGGAFCEIIIPKEVELYVKRVGNMILVSINEEF